MDLESALGKRNKQTAQGNPFHWAAGKMSMDPLAESWVQQKQTTLTTGEEADHRDPPPHETSRVRTVSSDPNADEQHVYESPDKPLMKR
ncbi:unnamed protein product [Alternaria alternata]